MDVDSSMKWLPCLIMMAPSLSMAQANKTGLENYVLGVTTPTSLNPTEFKEQDQPYVKGTIALPCTHVRTFTATQAPLEGISVTNLVVYFYDNRLVRIVCDYNDTLGSALTRQFGPGTHQPLSRFRVCTQEKDKFLDMWGEAWFGPDVVGIIINRKGYTTACQPEEDARLVIWSKPLSALCSECDLKPTDPLIGEYLRSLPFR